MNAWQAISLWQPWASLWCSGVKECETRHWPTSHRGWLVVQAAQRFERDFPHGHPLREILDSEFGGHWGMDLPRGAIVGAVHVVDCVPVEVMPVDHAGSDDYRCGDFSAGRFAWRANKFLTLKRPIPYRGRQGFFSVPANGLPEEILNLTAAGGEG